MQPFKCGPDYIDPAFMRRRPARASLNLDSWAMQPAHLASLMQAADGADLVLAEGSMGLFDGVATPGETGTGASADIAALAGWPVVLVLDISGQAQSAAATALGFATLRKDVALAGSCSIASRAPVMKRWRAPAWRPPAFACSARCRGSSRWRCRSAISASCRPRSNLALRRFWPRWPDFVAAHVDLAALRAIAAQTSNRQMPQAPKFRPPGNRVALARDAAFSFIYPHLLAGWRAAGAEILPFSPLADEAPDASSRCLLAAGRISGTACRTIGGCKPVPFRAAKLCRDRARCMASAVATWRWAKA